MRWGVKCLCFAMGGVFFSAVSAMADSNDFIQQARRAPDPFEKQRLLRNALAEDPENPEVLVMLGESQYHETGDIRGAVENLKKVIELGKDASGYAEGYLDEIGLLFKPLRIKLIDRRVSALGYIDGLEYRFRPPRSLKEHQKKRLKYLEQHASEFQLNGVDADGRPFFEIAYFPVVIDLDDRYSNYAIVVNNKRRYRFDFTEDVQDLVEIRWEDEWKLVERVPARLVKIEYPLAYTFMLEQGVSHFSIVDTTRQVEGRYIPADANTQLVLRDSKEKDKERRYSLAVKIAMGLAAVIGLVGTR